MRLLHPTDAGRSKDVPEDLAEKFLEHGWTKAEAQKTPAKKTATKPPEK